MFSKNDKKTASKKPTPFEIGLNGTVEEFRQANRIAKAKKDREFYYRHIGDKDQRELQKGAVDAFLAGRPDNLQAVISNPSEFTIYSLYDEEDVDCGAILSQLIKDNDRAAAVITLAIDKVPEQKKQDYLNKLLYRSVHYPYLGEELVVAVLEAGANANARVDVKKEMLSRLVEMTDNVFAILTFSAEQVPQEEKQDYLNSLLYLSICDLDLGKSLTAFLLESGAQADAEFNGFKGDLLAHAIRYERPLSVVELLHKAGADFNDALFFMKAKKWDAEEIKALKDYRKEITGEAFTIEVEPDILLQMQEQIKDLTEKVARLSEPVPAANSNTPAKPKAPRRNVL